MRDPHDFEFVIPVRLGAQRFAYEATYDHHIYDTQLNEVRLILALIGVLALPGGGAVFYLVGGRRLIGDHKMVLHLTPSTPHTGQGTSLINLEFG